VRSFIVAVSLIYTADTSFARSSMASQVNIYSRISDITNSN